MSYPGMTAYPRRGSNPRPSMYKIAALTTELRGLALGRPDSNRDRVVNSHGPCLLGDIRMVARAGLEPALPG